MPTLTDYSVGDLVVLGHDGVARIEDISSVDIDGEAATMLKLTVLSARMTVTIPLERALDRGLRAVADPATAQIALEKLATEPGMELVAGLTWDKQLKRLKERFGSGDLDGIVDVLATLVDADARRPLNHSQRMLRDKAEEAFITEIGAALELSPEDAQDQGRRHPRLADRPGVNAPIGENLFADPSFDLDPAEARRRQAAGELTSSISASSTSGTRGTCPGRVTSRSSASPRTRRRSTAHAPWPSCAAGVCAPAWSPRHSARSASTPTTWRADSPPGTSRACRWSPTAPSSPITEGTIGMYTRRPRRAARAVAQTIS